jgi:D-glycero-D-manno-heptose 1,7-bisphosphate phosphatase
MRNHLEILKDELSQRASRPNKAAVFIDRDGTINVERGYLSNPDDVTLLPTAGEAIHLLNQQNLPVIVITNQSALGRGLMTLPQLEAVNGKLWQALQQYQAHFDALYYCPHNPDEDPSCGCRKPQPGLFFQAALDLGLDLAGCFIVGDKLSDLEAGRACDCQTALVRTGWGEQTYREMISNKIESDHIGSTLLEVSRWIALQLGKTSH